MAKYLPRSHELERTDPIDLCLHFTQQASNFFFSHVIFYCLHLLIFGAFLCMRTFALFPFPFDHFQIGLFIRSFSVFITPRKSLRLLIWETPFPIFFLVLCPLVWCCVSLSQAVGYFYAVSHLGSVIAVRPFLHIQLLLFHLSAVSPHFTHIDYSIELFDALNSSQTQSVLFGVYYTWSHRSLCVLTTRSASHVFSLLIERFLHETTLSDWALNLQRILCTRSFCRKNSICWYYSNARRVVFWRVLVSSWTPVQLVILL